MNGNHISRHRVARSYAYIEALSHNVDRAILRHQVHLHVGIKTHKLKDDRRQNAPCRSNGTVDPQ